MTQLPFEDLPEKPAKGVSFADFWTPYPRKVGKRKAVAAFVKALGRASADKILAGLERYKANKPAYCDWMHPTTFLNGDHWEDEYDAPVKLAELTDKQILENAVWVIQHGTGNGHKFPVDREVARRCVDEGLVTEEQAWPWL